MFHNRDINNTNNHLHSFKDLLNRDKSFTIHQMSIQPFAIDLFKIKQTLSNKLMFDIFHTSRFNKTWDKRPIIPQIVLILTISLREKCSDTVFFLVRIFPHSDWVRSYTPYLSVFSPNARKYGPQKTLYLDTFHAVIWSKSAEILYV